MPAASNCCSSVRDTESLQSISYHHAQLRNLQLLEFRLNAHASAAAVAPDIRFRLRRFDPTSSVRNLLRSCLILIRACELCVGIKLLKATDVGLSKHLSSRISPDAVYQLFYKCFIILLTFCILSEYRHFVGFKIYCQFYIKMTLLRC